MISRKFINAVLPPYSVDVEPGRLRFFAKVIDERNPVYIDEAAARSEGYKSIPIPLTFLFSLENEVPDSFAFLTDMGIDLGRLLHGEESFTYHAPVYAGDRLTFEPRIADIYDKKNGALEFVTRETTVKNQDGVVVAQLREVFVVRNK